MTGTLHEHLHKCMTVFCWNFLETRNGLDKVVSKIQTYILRSKTFSRKSCRVCYNVEKYCEVGQSTDDNIKRRMRIDPLNAELNPIRHLLALVGARRIVHISKIRVKRWIPKATDTHSEYVILIVFHCINGCMKAPQC